MKTFQIALEIGRKLHETERPAALRKLRDAEHPTCRYYTFLYELVSVLAPIDIIEIGTYVGTSAAHLTVPNYQTVGDTLLHGQVITVDNNPDAKRCVDEIVGTFGLGQRLRSVIADSHAAVDDVADLLGGEKVDLLYVDGGHTFDRVWGEYVSYRDLVRDGGLMIFDDVGLAMDGDEMEVFWEAVPERKQRLDHLHPNVGFGIVEKQTVEALAPGMSPRVQHAHAEIVRRRKGGG